MLSALSHSAGFVFTSNVQDSTVQRLDFIPLGPFNLLAVLVTVEGVVKHWPVRVNYVVSPARMMMLNNYINEQISGLTMREAQRVLWENLNNGTCDSDGFCELACRILKDMTVEQNRSEQLYIEGMSQLFDGVGQEEYSEVSQMMRVMEERDKFAGFLGEKMQELQNNKDLKVSVSIGAENELTELKNLSIITSAYKVGDKTIGLLGIVGPKHMEYTKMMSLVNFIGDMLGTKIQNWQASLENKEEE